MSTKSFEISSVGPHLFIYLREGDRSSGLTHRTCPFGFFGFKICYLAILLSWQLNAHLIQFSVSLSGVTVLNILITNDGDTGINQSLDLRVGRLLIIITESLGNIL